MKKVNCYDFNIGIKVSFILQIEFVLTSCTTVTFFGETWTTEGNLGFINYDRINCNKKKKVLKMELCIRLKQLYTPIKVFRLAKKGFHWN